MHAPEQAKLELVADRANKATLPSIRLSVTIRALAMQESMLCYPLGETVDGKHGAHALLAPPFLTSEDEIVQIVAIFARPRQATGLVRRAPYWPACCVSWTIASR
jgi:adenosylmethionine-8-amino-7-oxononanoate aminotransferase